MYRNRKTIAKIIFIDEQDRFELCEVNNLIQNSLDTNIKTESGYYNVRIISVCIDPEQSPSIIIKCKKNPSTRISPLFQFLMNIFNSLNYLCIGFWIRKIALKNSRNLAIIIIDSYIIFWIVLESILFLFTIFFNIQFKYIALILACYRISELLIVYYNILIFDNVKSLYKGEYFLIISSSRSVLISFISFIEIAFCFAITYSSLGLSYFMGEINSFFDFLYFSVITITTLGYGDIQPLGIAKFFASSEAIIGLLFGLSIIARMISWLPEVKSFD